MRSTPDIHAGRRSGRGPVLAALAALMILLQGCGSTPDQPRPAGAEPVQERAAPAAQVGPQQMIEAGLERAAEAFARGERLRPYAAVYSELGGVRPVRLNDQARQASDSDIELLLSSIRALSAGPDLEAFAVFGLAVDDTGKRWFVVHYESREGGAQMRQYPVPPPANAADWDPVSVEPVRPAVF